MDRHLAVFVVSVRQHLIKEVPDDAALPVTPVVAQDVVSILVKARVGDVIPLGVEDETHPVPLAGTVPMKGLGDDLVEHIGLAAAGARQEQQGAFGGEGAQALLLVEVLVVSGDDLTSHLAKLRLLCLI